MTASPNTPKRLFPKLVQQFRLTRVEGRPGGVGQLEGLDLGRLLAAGPLSPAQAAAVGLGILSALEDRHEAARGAGQLTLEDVIVGADGRVRLRGGGQEHPSSSELAEDIRQAGRLICAALGIPVEPDTGALRPAERAMPAVAATVRAIANGAMGRNVALARAQFADTAGSLVAPERLRLSQTELSEHVRAAPAEAPPSRPVPVPVSEPVAPPPPAPAAAPPPRQEFRPAPAPPRPVTNWQSRPARRFEDDGDSGPPLRTIEVVAGVLTILVVAGILGAFVISKLMVSTGPAVATPAVSVAPASPVPTASSKAAPSPTSTTGTLPTYAPPAQGTIKSVGLAANGSCAVGSNCALEITLNFTKASADTDYAWTFKAFDPCTGTTTDVATGHFTAKAGWVQIISDRSVKLPTARGQLYVVAVTTSPDQAQSPALPVGQGSC
jgi:hypothetical protein